MESRSSPGGQSLHLNMKQILNPCLQALIAKRDFKSWKT